MTPETSSNSNAGRKRRRSARVKPYGPHVISLNRAAYEQIADKPLFEYQQGPPGSSRLTLCSVVGPVAPRDRWILIGAGARERLRRLLGAAGISADALQPAAGWSWPDSPDDRPVSECLRRAEGRSQTLAIVPKLVQRIARVTEVCHLCPESHVLVVARDRSEASQIGRALKSQLQRTVTWAPNPREGHPWIHVVDPQALAGICPNHWEFVIFMDAESALSKTAFCYLGYSYQSVHIGFLTRNERSLPGTDYFAIEQLFGPVIYRSRDEYARSDVLVTWLDSSQKPTKLARTDLRKRQQIWNNHARNRLIATVARALSNGNAAELERLGMTDAAAHVDALSAHVAITVLVENLEHARELQRHLPGWRVEGARFEPPRSKVLRQDGLIMTFARAATLPTPICTPVFIYGAGGDERWLEYVPFATEDWFNRNVLIIDLADTGEPRCAQETASRRAEYRYHQFRQMAAQVLRNQAPTRLRPRKEKAVCM